MMVARLKSTLEAFSGMRGLMSASCKISELPRQVRTRQSPRRRTDLKAHIRPDADFLLKVLQLK